MGREARPGGPPQHCWPGGSSMLPLRLSPEDQRSSCVEDASHTLNYPRSCGKRNEFLWQFFAAFNRNPAAAFTSRRSAKHCGHALVICHSSLVIGDSNLPRLSFINHPVVFILVR